MFKKLLAVAVVAFSLGALAQGKVQIEFWSWYLSPKFDPFLDGVAKDFEAKYPNITVKRVDKQDTMERDLQAQIALGQAPDVVNLWLDATFSAVQAGLGVALVPQVYVENELSSGALVAPWPVSARLNKNFCLVKPVETGINESALEDFERWLVAEISGEPA